MRPKITVLLPVYNGEKYIEQTLISLLNQTFSDFEVFVIDDGSTDKTLNILFEYSKYDKRIKIFHNSKNEGIIYSLNLGLCKANSNLIARMDCGDIAEKERFKKQINFLNKNQDYILIGTQCYFINLDNEIIGKSNFPTEDYDIRKELFLKKNIIIHPSVIFRWNGKIFYNHCAYSAEDYDLWLRMAKLGKISILNDYLIKIRLEFYGTTFNKKRQQMMVVNKIHKNFFYKSQSNISETTFLKNNKYTKYYEQIFLKATAKLLKYKKRTLKWFLYILFIYILCPKMIYEKILYSIKKMFIHKSRSFKCFLEIKNDN